MAETVTPTVDDTRAPGEHPPRAHRLVLLRLGQLGLPDHGHHRVPRPVPDHRRRAGRRLRAGRGHLRRVRAPAGHPRGGRLLLPVPDLAVGVPDRVRAAGHRGDRRPVGAQEAAARPGPRSPAPGATIAMAFVTGDRYLLGGALFLVANIAFGAAIVVYNSFLPQLGGPDERDGISSRGWAHRLPRRRPAAGVQPGRGHPAQRGRQRRSAPWTWPAGRSCRPGCGGRRSPLVPLRWLRERPSAAAAARRAAATCSPTASGSSAAPCARSRRTR